MVKKNTRAQQLIENMGELIGVHYTDKTYKNLEKILKCYRSIKTSKNTNVFDTTLVSTSRMNDLFPRLYDAFLASSPITNSLANELTICIINSTTFDQIFLDTEEKVKNIDEVGELYYEIIHQLYFEKAFPSNTDIYDGLNISQNVYSYRKVEATMAFGIIFWQELMKYWKNIAKEAPEIEKKYGRHDMISDRCDLSALEIKEHPTQNSEAEASA